LIFLLLLRHARCCRQRDKSARVLMPLTLLMMPPALTLAAVVMRATYLLMVFRATPRSFVFTLRSAIRGVMPPAP